MATMQAWVGRHGSSAKGVETPPPPPPQIQHPECSPVNQASSLRLWDFVTTRS